MQSAECRVRSAECARPLILLSEIDVETGFKEPKIFFFEGRFQGGYRGVARACAGFASSARYKKESAECRVQSAELGSAETAGEG